MIKTITASDPYDLSEKLNKLDGKWELISVVKHGNAFVAFLQKQDNE